MEKQFIPFQKASEEASKQFFGYIEGDYTVPFRHGAQQALELCRETIMTVLENYEPEIVVSCIMADFEEIISTEIE